MELEFLPDAGRDAGGDDGEVPSSNTGEDEVVESKAAAITVDTAVANELNLAMQSPTPVHEEDPAKRKRWRANVGVQRQIQRALKGDLGRHISGADPFGAFELPQDSTTDLALHHFLSELEKRTADRSVITVFQKTRMPPTPRQSWMEINLSDKTLLSVATYCSSNHYFFIRGLRAPPITLIQKVNAIQNINKTLQKGGSMPNDFTMIAVAVMTLLECLAGELTACVVHRKGLQQMVELRGGLQNLGLDGAVQRTISWADTCCAIHLGIKPTLKPSLIANAGESAIPGFTIGDLKERLLAFTNSPDLSRKVIYIWLRLRYLAQILAAIPIQTPTAIDDIYFSDKIDIVERHVLSVLHSDSLTESDVVDFLTAFLNASLIYIYEELRECPKWTNVCMALSQRIRSGLQMAKLSTVTKHCPDLLLWTLLLGRSGYPPIPDHGKLWYSTVIANMEAGLEMTVPPSLVGLKYFEIVEGAAANGSPASARTEENEVSAQMAQAP